MSRGWVGWIPAAIWAAVLFLVSHQPTISVNLSGGRDKLAHFGAYLILGLLLAVGRGPQARTLWLILLGSLYGIIDELHQSFVPGRSADIWDVAADILGATTGVLIYRLARRRISWSGDELAAQRAETKTT